jgi:FixJ family two-component response regulator
MKDEPTVFVVDADAATRAAIRDLASLMNLQCEMYASGAEFLNAYSLSRPGCLVMEVRIPVINGLEIQDRLAEQGAAIPVVFLTAQATVSIAVHAMRAGALHFLEKPFREPELWGAIQEAISLDAERRRVSTEREELKKGLAQLTSEERQLLEMVGEGRSNRAMASQFGVCMRTIELRRSRLRTKLGLSSPIELARVALIACDERPMVLRGMEKAGRLFGSRESRFRDA